MTATTASASRPSTFFSHRYSESMASAHSRDSSYMQSFSSSSPSTNIREGTTSRMASSILSPNVDPDSGLAKPLPARRSSHGDVPANSSSSSGVKYACASCIRGHRTSSCTHQDGSKGPLQPIRSKGRPPTQCEICRKKRKETGRHVRCDCTGKKISSTATAATSTATVKKQVAPKTNAPILPRISDHVPSFDQGGRPAKRSRIQLKSNPAQSTSTLIERRFSDADSSDETLSQSSAPDNILAPIRPLRASHSWSLPSIHSTHDAHPAPYSSSRADEEATPRRSSTLSLSSLMNPCGCRSTGSCTTCSEQRKRRAPVSPKQLSSALDNCDRVLCSSSKSPQQHPIPPATTSMQLESPKARSSSCCTGKGSSASAAPSIELLLRAVDMTTEFVPPPCGCGPGCRCSRCLVKQGATSAMASTDVRRPASNGASSTIASSSVSPRTPPATLAAPPAPSAPGCDDCAACDLALERPSGIGAVDSWMEKQRASPPRRRSPSPDGNPARAARASPSAIASVPTLHGGLLTSGTGDAEEVHAELVLVHPKCAACLEVVRTKGVGVLSSGPSHAK